MGESLPNADNIGAGQPGATLAFRLTLVPRYLKVDVYSHVGDDRTRILLT